jgi:uncharacterized membrane protein YeaQ/YmgE (transglycosylase-associated protein family)
MIGALILGLVAGFVGKALMPGDDPGGFVVTILLGLAGAALGWVVFTLGLGIGDDDMFDLGGLVGAIIGVMVLLFAYRKFVESRADHSAPEAPGRTGSPREPRGSGRKAGV